MNPDIDLQLSLYARVVLDRIVEQEREIQRQEEATVVAAIHSKVFQGNLAKRGTAEHCARVALKAIRDFEPQLPHHLED